MIKAKFGASARMRTPVAQVNEVLAKVLCHNICVLIQSAYELGVGEMFTIHPRDELREGYLRPMQMEEDASPAVLDCLAAAWLIDRYYPGRSHDEWGMSDQGEPEPRPLMNDWPACPVPVIAPTASFGRLRALCLGVRPL